MNCLFKIKDYLKLEKVSKEVLSIDKKDSKALAYYIRDLNKNNKFKELERVIESVKTKLGQIKKAMTWNIVIQYKINQNTA